ncbi:MAG: hypothetical protein ACRBI6_18840 [Acidimicrobiales bacterium]
MTAARTPRLIYSGAFRDTFQRLQSDPQAVAGLSAAMTYLADFGRSAVSPDVQWHLQTSAYGSHAGEVRWPNPEDQHDHPGQAWRGLFVAAVDTSWIIFTVLGNKAIGPARGNDWYRSAVPRSDDIAAQAIEMLGLTAHPSRHE